MHVLRGRAELLQGDLRAEVVEREGLVLVRDVRPGVLLIGLHPLGAELGDLGRARDLGSRLISSWSALLSEVCIPQHTQNSGTYTSNFPDFPRTIGKS